MARIPSAHDCTPPGNHPATADRPFRARRRARCRPHAGPYEGRAASVRAGAPCRTRRHRAAAVLLRLASGRRLPRRPGHALHGARRQWKVQRVAGVRGAGAAGRRRPAGGGVPGPGGLCAGRGRGRRAGPPRLPDRLHGGRPGGTGAARRRRPGGARSPDCRRTAHRRRRDPAHHRVARPGALHGPGGLAHRRGGTGDACAASGRPPRHSTAAAAGRGPDRGAVTGAGRRRTDGRGPAVGLRVRTAAAVDARPRAGR